MENLASSELQGGANWHGVYDMLKLVSMSIYQTMFQDYPGLV